MAFWNRRSRCTIRAATLLCAMAGCGGASHETVSYEPPPMQGPFVNVKVPDVSTETTPNSVAKVTFPDRVQPDAALVFEGRFRPHDTQHFGTVVVQFVDPNRGGKRVIIAQKLVESEPAEDGWQKYRVEMKAPNEKVRCKVEVIEMGFVFAGGEVDVE
jgi:hypothetical protein